MQDMTFLVLALLLSVLLTIHPYTTYPLSLSLIRRFRAKPLSPTAPAPRSYAIACCMYNEVDVAGEKIQNMYDLQQVLGNCEILLHSDCSSDGTDDVLRLHADRIKLSFAGRRSGKSFGMNSLMSMTNAEIIIFTDANVRVDPATVANVGHYFRDPEVGCVTGHLKYTNPGESETARAGSIYWFLEEHIKQIESDTGSVMGADGSLFAIRRALHEPAPVDIIDDFHTSMSILCSGARLVRGENFVAYERGATGSTDEMRRKIRISCRAFNCHRLLWPRIRRLDALTLYKYVSHKLMRWLSGYFMLAGIVIAAVLASMLFGVLGLIGYVLTLAVLWLIASRWDLPVIGTVYEIVVATVATAIGVYESMRGKRFQTWTITSSTRK